MLTLRTISLLLLGVAFTVSCDLHEWSFDEVARVPSPSGRVEAVLVEGNGGASTSFGYYVYVVPKGKSVSRKDAEVANLYGAVRSERAYGVDLKWESEDGLACEYLRAKAADRVTNIVAVAGVQVTISLHSNINNSAAPSGGMLHNLKKR